LTDSLLSRRELKGVNAIAIYTDKIAVGAENSTADGDKPDPHAAKRGYERADSTKEVFSKTKIVKLRAMRAQCLQT
jgi:hypothetical protein